MINDVRTEGVKVAFIVKVNSFNFTFIARDSAAINCRISFVVLLLPFCEKFCSLVPIIPNQFHQSLSTRHTDHCPH